MKKVVIITLSLFLFLTGAAFAYQDGADLQLSDAGLTPNSPFYFLDRLFENIQLTLTRNPESKARLHVRFAQERLSEIDVLIENKGSEDKSIDKLQENLTASLTGANQTLTQQKQKGQDVSELAREINNAVKNSGKAFKNNSKKRLRNLKFRAENLSSQLRQASQAGSIAKARELSRQLGKVRGEIEFTKARLDSIGGQLEKGAEESEEEMSLQDKAVESVNDLEEDLAEMRTDAKAQGIDVGQILPSGVPNTIQEARSALDTGKFEQALSLAQGVESDLKSAEEELENAEEEKEAAREAEEKIMEKELKLKEVQSELPEGVSIPQEALSNYNNLLSQARSALEAGNHQEAEKIAEQAEEALDKATEAVEQEKEEEEKQRERKQEAKEVLNEIQREFRLLEIASQGKRSEAVQSAFDNFKTQFSKAQTALDNGNYEEAQRLAEQAEESVKGVEEAIEEEKEKLEEEREREREEREARLEREEEKREKELEREEEQEEAGGNAATGAPDTVKTEADAPAGIPLEKNISDEGDVPPEETVWSDENTTEESISEACREDIERAVEAAKGKTCEQLLVKMVCPDNNQSYTAPNVCAAAELKKMGWMEWESTPPPENPITTSIHPHFKTSVRKSWQEVEDEGLPWSYTYLPPGETYDDLHGERIHILISRAPEDYGGNIISFFAENLAERIKEEQKTIPDLTVVEGPSPTDLDGVRAATGRYRGSVDGVKMEWNQTTAINNETQYTITYYCPVDFCDNYSEFERMTEYFIITGEL